MGQVEGAAEGVTELVVQRHGGRGKHRSAQPGAVLGLGPRLEVTAVGDDPGQRGGQGPGPLLGHQRDDRRRIRGVEALDRVRDRVETAGHRHPGGQGQGELRVVEHAPGQHPHVAAGPLLPALGQPPHRRHLRAGVGGRDGDHRQLVLQRDRLAQPDRRPAAHGHAAVGAQLRCTIAGPAGDLDRHVHPRLGQHAGRPLAQGGGDRPAGVLLLGRAQDQHAGQPQGRHLVGQLRQGTGAEHHSHGQRLVREGTDHDGAPRTTVGCTSAG